MIFVLRFIIHRGKNKPPWNFEVTERLNQLGLKPMGTIYKVLLMYNHINSEIMQENGFLWCLWSSLEFELEAIESRNEF